MAMRISKVSGVKERVRRSDEIMIDRERRITSNPKRIYRLPVAFLYFSSPFTLFTSLTDVI